MAHPNEKTGMDQHMRGMIEGLGIKPDEQGSQNIEIKEALKTASKQKPGNAGMPEFIFNSSNFLVVVEDKADIHNSVKYDSDGYIDLERPHIANYALNGAVHYAKHIINNTSSITSVFAVGASGDASQHDIRLVYIKNDDVQELEPVDNIDSLHPDNIGEFYRVNVLGDLPREDRDLQDIQDIASELHEDLRNHGSLEGEKKASVVSAILLALEEGKKGSFDIDDLKSSMRRTDGMYIYDAIDVYLENSSITPHAKRGSLLDQFKFIRQDITLNTPKVELGMSPIKYFTRKLYDKLYDRFRDSNFDILGSFYGEFVKYGGSDGNSLGIVLTPRHITDLMVELVNVNKHDKVLDPACGTGSFLITAMNRMIEQCDEPHKDENNEDSEDVKKVKHEQLHGIELQQRLFTIATTNMILRGDGKSNLRRDDIFHDELDEDVGQEGITKVLINPPYSQAKTKQLAHLSEISFIKRAMTFIEPGGQLAAIVPQSTMVGKTKDDKLKKKALLENHTLEHVITLNPDTFHGVGVNPCIVVLTAGQPHPEQKRVNFVNFTNDGYYVRKHVGLVGDGTQESKKKHLMDVVKYNAPANTEFLVRSTVTWEDEWLHSFYYFNDTPPSVDDFMETMADYLSFEFDMKAHGRGYLFEDGQADVSEED